VAYQQNFNAYVAREVQSALGTIASGAGATILRGSGGTGGSMSKVPVESNEIRSDGMRTRGRHGSQRTTGPYEAELSLGNQDDIIEAVMRGTYAAALTITEATASLTSITTTTSTIVAGGGSWITAGLRVGDVVRLTNHSTAGNNNINIPITALTASTITTTTALTANAVADTAFTITRPGRKVINPAVPVQRYFTIEEYESDIDQSEVYQDAKFTAMTFEMRPDGLIMFNPTWNGTGYQQVLPTGSSPYFTSPTLPTGAPLAVIDASILVNGVAVVDLTAFSLTFDIGSETPAVLSSKYAPDVFTGQMALSGSITALRKDLSYADAFLNETQLSLHVVAVELESEPKDFVSIYIPNFTLGSVDKSALSKNAGARTQTLQIPQALLGKDERGGAYEPTMAVIQLSTAA